MKKIIECNYCGRRFRRKYQSQKYCSLSCRRNAKREQNTKTQAKRRIKIIPLKNCKYCGKIFFCKHGNEEYCSYICRKYALQEKKNKYQRDRRKLINDGVLISNENEQLGTGFLSQHRHKSFDKEKEVIKKELERLGLS